VPIFGDRSRFAVEYELDANHGNEWMFGRFCYWCDGCQVGDYELGTSLRDVLFQLDEIAHYSGRRRNQRFSKMPAAGAFRLLNGTLFGRPDISANRLSEEEQWARHQVLPPLDVFDDWRAFLVESDECARLLYARDPYSHVKEVILMTGEIDALLTAARDSLQRNHEAAAGK
jgi:hypothetical protein